jgi:flagellar biosynthesis anti-sigma factor FlgM
MSVKMSELVSPNATTSEESKKEVKVQVPPKAQMEDATVVSQRSSPFQALQQKIADTPIVDMQKVEMVKSKLADNKLELNPKRIAEKILKLEDEIFSNSNSKL